MVPLDGITVGNEIVNYDFSEWTRGGGKAFLDSGTTFVYFDHNLFDSFKQAITKHCEKKDENCVGKKSY